MLTSNIVENHKDSVQKILSECDDGFVIVSPFLASKMDSFLDEFDFSGVQRLDMITTFKGRDVEQLTKPFQLRNFLNYFKNNYPKMKVYIHINNKLHGKLYISAALIKKMIVTSANFTMNGMHKNHEWGVVVEDPDIVKEALEEVLESIEYPELTLNQLNKACMFAEANIKVNPDWEQKIKITSDILKSVYSDADPQNDDPQYFLKPIGHTKKPITLDGRENFSNLHQELHFAKRPSGVRKGDFIITTAVGAGSLLSYFRVTGGIQEVTRKQLENNLELKRWPWFVEGRNNSVKFGKAWWLHNIRRQDILEEFKNLYPGTTVTFVGGFGLGTIKMGNDKVRISQEFGKFLINRIIEFEELS
ncbi:MAG: phospholipase D family protein [Hyphomicrobiales bacterium]